jgi:hypothetical protein
VSLPDPPAPSELIGFPVVIMPANVPLARIHHNLRDPEYFSADGSGRFDPRPGSTSGFGTCYLSTHPLGAFLETFGRIRPVLHAMTAVAACGGATTPSVHDGRGEVQPLRFSAVPLEVVPSPQFEVRGSYPQLFDGSVPETVANKAMYAGIIANEEVAYSTPGKHPVRATVGSHTGSYWLVFDPSEMSANTAVVSVLFTVYYAGPGGAGSSYWFGVTVDMGSGRTVSMEDLFADPQKGWTAVARAAQEIAASNASPICRADALSSQTYEDVFAPGPAGYQGYVLAPAGLQIGIPPGVLCNPTTTVPWSEVSPYLGALGRSLVAGIRPPQTPISTTSTGSTTLPASTSSSTSTTPAVSTTASTSSTSQVLAGSVRKSV